MRNLLLNLLLGLSAIALCSIAAAAVMAAVTQSPVLAPQVVPSVACTFDGGGTVQDGTVARTSDGRTWACEDGTLMPVSGQGNPSVP